MHQKEPSPKTALTAASALAFVISQSHRLPLTMLLCMVAKTYRPLGYTLVDRMIEQIVLLSKEHGITEQEWLDAIQASLPPGMTMPEYPPRSEYYFEGGRPVRWPESSKSAAEPGESK